MKKLLVALLMLPALARAEFWTGNDLHANLTSSDVMLKMQALGYIMGAYDVGVSLFFCPPNQRNITAGQINDIVKQYLERNPSTRNRTADQLVLEALKQVWPCQNRGGGGTRL